MTLINTFAVVPPAPKIPQDPSTLPTATGQGASRPSVRQSSGVNSPSRSHRSIRRGRRVSSTGHIALPPELGFLFPAFDDRAANIYNALFYSKNAAEIHQEVIDAVFRVTPPLSAEEQKNAFGTALGDTLQQDCSYDVVQSVHEQLRQRIVEHKESRDPQPLTLTLHEVGDMLAGSGATVRQAEAFQEECRRQYGDDAALDAKNLMESGKFQITTPEVKISVSPEYSAMIEARVIDGRKYILIPADESVEVNGIAVNIPNPQNRESC